MAVSPMWLATQTVLIGLYLKTGGAKSRFLQRVRLYATRWHYAILEGLCFNISSTRLRIISGADSRDCLIFHTWS